MGSVLTPGSQCANRIELDTQLVSRELAGVKKNPHTFGVGGVMSENRSLGQTQHFIFKCAAECYSLTVCASVFINAVTPWSFFPF